MLSDLAHGIASFFSLVSVGTALLGLIAGIVVGAIPGLTATMAIAVLSPFTFFMDTAIALPFLLGVYKGAIYGGSIPAVLINTPGTAAAAATTLDGHALAKQGRARHALEMSLYASVMGDMLGTVVLISVTAPLAAIAIKFSSPEFTILFIFALSLIASVSGDSILKGLIAAAAGALIGCIGLDPMSGYQRFTFGVSDLSGGIALVPVLIGMFAISEVLIQSEKKVLRSVSSVTDGRGAPLPLSAVRRVIPTILRASAIGTFIGALPGLGAEIACWVAYGDAKRQSKTPGLFGRGALEGVAAAESGNNATVPATLIPMLVFGIPGDTVTAILLGAFMAQGLLPGPLLFQQHSDVIYGLFGLLLLTNLLLLGFGLAAIRIVRHVVLIPHAILLPCVTVVCFAGSYAVSSNMFDVLVMLTGGFAGYAMRKAAVPIPPFVIALLLASPLENAIRQSLLFSAGGISIFVTRPISATLLGLFALSMGFVAWRALSRRRNRAPSTVADAIGDPNTP